MTEAGYTESERLVIRDEVSHYEKVRQEVKLASGDYVDLKVFEPAMRHLLDTYIRAEDSEVVTAFDDMTLVDLLVRDGAEAIGELPEGIRSSPGAVAETIENNVRRLIVDEMAVNPKYYEKMSAVLDALIRQRKEEAIEYEAYLRKVIELAEKVKSGEGGASYPESIKTRASLRAIYDNLWEGAPATTLAESGPNGGPDGDADPREAVHCSRQCGPGRLEWTVGATAPSRRSESGRAIRDALGPFREQVNTLFQVVEESE